MAKNSSFSVGRLLLQIAIGALLVIGGIMALTGSGDFGAKAIREVFNGTAEKICIVVFGILELIAGLFIILDIFLGNILGKYLGIIILIIAIVWIIAIIFADFLGGHFLSGGFLPWLWDFASHLLVLGGLFCIKTID